MTEKFQLSLFKNKYDTIPRVEERTWQLLCSKFRNPQVRSEKDGLLFSPALFEPSKRLKENVKEISLLCFDVDHDADFEQTKSCFDLLGCAYAVYSTHSHLRKTDSNPNAEPRFRVVVPLACPIQVNKFSSLWQYAKQQTRMPFDESTKDSSRMFYTPVKAEPNAPYQFCIKNGDFLDWQVLPLDTFANGEPSFNAKNANGANQNGNEQNSNFTDFEFHEDRHAELCRQIEKQGKDTGRGTFEMKCPAHNGKGESSLFYDPVKQTVACLKKPKCDYFDLLTAFGLPNKKLPSRENADQQKREFEETETKIKPFPVPSEKCFYGLAGEFVQLIEPHTEADKIALLSQFLVYFGNIVGRTAYYQIEGDKHFTNIFCILIGETAQGRKGTSFGRVTQIFKGTDEHHETNCLVGGLASGEGLLYRVRDPFVITKKDKETGEMVEVIADNGISDKRLLVSEGEFVQVLRVQGREGNTLSGFIRNLWDKGTAQSMTKNSPLKTTDAHVSIVGHITKTELVFALNEVDAANGYANRFLFFAVKRSKFLPFGADVRQIDLIDLRNKISDSIDFARTKGQMNFSIEASQVWAENYERLETSRFGYLAKITQRASPYVLRLSLIYALLDKSNLIEKEHLEAALAVWQYSENSARYIFGEQLENRDAQKILNALQENSETGLARSEIRDLFDRHITNQKLNAALSLLLEYNLAEPIKQETKGRSKEIWFPCVKSVKSVFSSEIISDELPYNAYNAKNATEEKMIQKELCPECESYLSFFKNNELYCEVCLYTKTI
jgi:hypothetical protein